ncbi:MAG: DUF998 domain-containing protein [Actinomycetota bacterium]|nr:DUF998 domain-containing protein [Actinomycetota bacterium]
MWALASAGVAPIALTAGEIIGAAKQPTGYSSVRNSISALAERGATDRWIMTAALVILGVCYILTAVGVTDCPSLARWLLALGGAATVVVAALPQPSAGHVPAAAIAFVALAVWPAVSLLPSRPIAFGVTVLLIGLLLWFGLQLSGGWLGLTERFLVTAEALWPLALTLTLFLRRNPAAQ